MKKLSCIITVLLFTILSLTAQSTNKLKATLAWDPNPTNEGVNNYKLYMGGTTGTYTNSISVGNVTIYTITNMTENVPYFFVVTAVSTNGLESDYSNEAKLGSTLNYSNLTVFPPSNLTPNSATLSLRVSGTANPVNAWFRYGTSPTNLNIAVGRDSLTPSGGVLNFSTNLVNLTETTYYYRGFCWMWTNGIGIYSTPVASFTLPQKPASPTNMKVTKVEEVVK